MSAQPLPAPIEELRVRVAALGEAQVRPVFAFGLPEIDERLAGGGLVAGLHDVTGASPTLADDAAATLFAAGIGARTGGHVLWVLTRFDLYAPGLEQAGLVPDRLIYVEARDDIEALAVIEDALRDGTVACVIGEVRRAGMTATRRLHLAAAERGKLALLQRRWRKADPLLEPSAAATRWRLACASSARLPVPGVGRARWQLACARQRNGDAFSLMVEGCDEAGCLAVPAAIADRAIAAPGTAAWAA